MKDITAIILAGGHSSRMGQDKGLMCINGTPMIQMVINVVMSITNKIIIISNNEDYKKFGLPVFEDIHKEKGPLAGIHTGLINSKTTKNLVLTCDSPFINEEIITTLVDSSDGFSMTYPALNNRIYPLTAVYDIAMIPLMETQLKSDNLRVKDLVDLVDSKKVDLNSTDDKALSNLNTIEDFNIITP